jgi:hypothetical protein
LTGKGFFVIVSLAVLYNLYQEAGMGKLRPLPLEEPKILLDRLVPSGYVDRDLFGNASNQRLINMISNGEQQVIGFRAVIIGIESIWSQGALRGTIERRELGFAPVADFELVVESAGRHGLRPATLQEIAYYGAFYARQDSLSRETIHRKSGEMLGPRWEYLSTLTAYAVRSCKGLPSREPFGRSLPLISLTDASVQLKSIGWTKLSGVNFASSDLALLFVREE